MDSFDTPNLLSGGSQLLDQSPQFSFNSASSSLHTGPGGDDLSLSELYPDNRLPKTEPQTPNPKTRPSIAEALGFGAPPDQSDDQSVLHALEEGEEREEEDAGIGEDEESTEADVTVRGGDEDANRTSIAAQSREEKLQSDLFVLRQLNGAFAVYNDALREAQGGTEVSCSCFYWLLRVFFFLSHTTITSVSPSSSNRRTHYSTNTSISYPSPSRSSGLYSTSDGWAPRRYGGYLPPSCLFAR